MNTDILVAVIATAAITALLISWFYERELNKQHKISKALASSHIDRTYDWLSARAEAQSLREQLAGHWSFSDSLAKHGNGVTDEHLATLFDNELMLGNHD